MTFKYYLSPVAEQDIDEIITYLARENPTAAHKFLDMLYDAMEKLSENPDMGHLREDLTDKPVKNSGRSNGIILLFISQLIQLKLSGY